MFEAIFSKSVLIEKKKRPRNKTQQHKYLSYTLKEGEYFYYTDMNKTDIAFYGSGTTIKRNLKTSEIYKYTTDEVISAEEISAAGLNASIP